MRAQWHASPRYSAHIGNGSIALCRDSAQLHDERKPAFRMEGAR